MPPSLPWALLGGCRSLALPVGGRPQVGEALDRRPKFTRSQGSRRKEFQTQLSVGMGEVFISMF